MNGEIPSVPIITLAGINSLTDLLPVLPVAGPSPSSSTSCPSSNLLYHSTLEQESSHLLARPSEALASQLGHALSSTPVDHIVLNPKNVAVFMHPNAPSASQNSSVLQAALYRRDQTLFQSLNSQQQVQVQAHWNTNGSSLDATAAMAAAAPANYSPGHNFSHNSPNDLIHQQNYYNNQTASYGYHNNQAQSQPQPSSQPQAPAAQAQPQQNSGGQNSGLSSSHIQAPQAGNNSTNNGSNNESRSNSVMANNAPTMPQVQPQPPEQHAPLVNHHQAQEQPQTKLEPKIDPETPSKANSESKNNIMKPMKPMLMLNKLSKEDEELMQKSIKAYAKQNPDRAQDLGLKNQRVNRRTLNKIESPSSSDSEGGNENDGPKKPKSKFFRATEKERDEEKRKAKEERRKRRLEQDPDDVESGGNLGKRRRRNSEGPDEAETEELKPFVPKKVTKKVERKLIPMIMKIDAAEFSTGNILKSN